MAQVQALQGFFRDGKFISSQTINIPENIEVFITITGRKISDDANDLVVQNKLSAEQLEIAKNVLLGVEKITANGLSKEALESFESLERGDFKPKFEERLL